MPDPLPPSDNDGIDRAFRAALAAAPSTEAPGRAQQRRRDILAAVQASAVSPHQDEPATAANDPRWQPSAAVWRGLAAACVLVASSLVVTRLLDEGADDAGFTPPAVSTSAPAGSPSAPTGSTATPAAPTVPMAATNPPTVAPPLLGAEPAERRSSAAKAFAKPAAPAETPRPAADAQTPTVPTAPRVATAPATAQARDNEADGAAQRAMASGATAKAAAAPAVAQPAPAPAPDTARADANPSVAQQAMGMASAERAADARSEAKKAESVADSAIGGAGQGRAAEARPMPRPTPRAAQASNATALPTPPDSLLAAVSRGDVESAKQWLAGVGADAQQDGDGRSALALAVLRSDLAMVKLLLASGANRLAADRFGQTPQGYAAKQADPALRATFGLP